MKKISVASVIAMTCLCLPTHAELFPVSSIFSEMDANKDGLINRQEINKKSLLATEFDKVDKNKDDSLDFREFEYFVVSVNI